MKLPFLPYKKQERAFRSFLRKNLSLTSAEVRKQEEHDDLYLLHDLTYTEIQEIFDAGWEAAKNAIRRAK